MFWKSSIAVIAIAELEKIILEYTKQMKLFREAIIQAIPEKCRPVEKEISVKTQPTLEKFMR
ncbi:MAG: hypothetical protein QXI65_07180 [Metallosphaera sp.]